MDHPRAAAGAVLLAALAAVPLAGIPGAAAAGAPSAAADGVQVRVGAAGDEARVHGTVDYAVTVANTGPEDLPDARIVQLLPEGLDGIEAGQDGEAGDGEVVWERGLPAGEAVELESSGTVRADAGGRLATTVCVRPAPGEGLVGCASDSLPVGPVSKAWIAAWTAAAAGALLLLAVGGRWLLQMYRRFREDGVRIEYVTGRVAIPEPPLALARMPWRYRLQLLQAVPATGTRTGGGESTQALAPEAAAGPAEAALADPEQDRAEAPEAAKAVSETPAEDVRTGAAHDDEARKDAEPEPSGAASEDTAEEPAAEEPSAEPDAGDGGDRDAVGAEADGQSAGEAAGAEPEEAAEDRETAEARREEPAAGGEDGAPAAGTTGAEPDAGKPDAEEERPAGEGAAAEREAGEEASEDGASDTGAAAEEQDPAGDRQAGEAGGDRSAEAVTEGTGATEEDAAVPAQRGRRKGRKPWSRKRKPRRAERGVPEQAAGDGSAGTAEDTAAERDLAPAERD
ncbi:DUF11 domain-containing protein [Nocardiopsis potens]|uniref:DUF11 domain-containing protein n=1 Tax=Nocardiopsis potens TaxID=1246458 RepID=UPI00034D4C6A|nr:DUF11 domain-containing protein [Nocardiopsis potens]